MDILSLIVGALYSSSIPVSDSRPIVSAMQIRLSHHLSSHCVNTSFSVLVIYESVRELLVFEPHPVRLRVMLFQALL
jgi:hypothetical protein